MKALVGMLVVFGFAAGSAFAATPQTDQSVQSPAKKKKKKKKKSTGQFAPSEVYRSAAIKSKNSGLSGSATQAVPPVAPTSAAPNTQTTATTVAAIKETPLKRWSVIYDSWNEFSAESTNLGHGDVDGYQAIGLSYMMNPTTSLQAVGLFENSFGATTQNRKVFATLDPYIAVSKTELLGNTGGITSSGYLRFYPGVSEGSVNKGQIGFFRGGSDIGGDVTKWFRLAWDTQPRYYFQSYKTFNTLESRDESGNPIKDSHGNLSVEKPNTQAVFTHFAAMTFTFSKEWSFYQNTGVSYAWYHSDPNSMYTTNKGKTYPNRDVNHEENFYGESGLIYAPIPQLAITAGIYTFMSRNLLAQSDDFHFYNKDALYFVDFTGAF